MGGENLLINDFDNNRGGEKKFFFFFFANHYGETYVKMALWYRIYQFATVLLVLMVIVAFIYKLFPQLMHNSIHDSVSQCMARP